MCPGWVETHDLDQRNIAPSGNTQRTRKGQTASVGGSSISAKIAMSHHWHVSEPSTHVPDCVGECAPKRTRPPTNLNFRVHASG